MAYTSPAASVRSRPMTAEERKVIIASSAGTIFEWYDFYLYGSLAAIIGAQFFTPFPEATRNVFALLAFAAGFIVRPFGALVFGALGDLIGRKYTFLATILIMGLSTFLVGMLPSYFSWGIAAPIILIVLRMLQGLALGGEYGGAAVYVAEHAPQGRRGYFTSFIQTTATLGLLLSLVVILLVQGYVNGNYPDQPVLDESAHWVAIVPDGRPEPRITLTYPALQSSRLTLFLVAGAAKRSALARARAGDPAIPAGRLKPEGDVIWLVDRAAAGTDAN